MKVAIVGCGKIADSHAWAIQHIGGCEIVGVCDREELMAQQLQRRFPIRAWYTDVTTLLVEAKPDVVHITTPAQSHFEIARRCLAHGSHVYIEKPFTCFANEAVEIIDFAKQRNLKVTAGHDDQFRHAARRMRDLVRTGYLGDGPKHLESYYGYEIGGEGYAKALLGDRQHWVRSLPGGLLQNVISHGIARIAEFMTTEAPVVIAYGFVSPVLRSFGEDELIDELRVVIADGSGSTAYFTFSSQLRPSLHQFRILGARNGLVLDQDNETLIRLSGSRRKSYLEQFIPPVVFARQYLGNLAINARSFLVRDFHSKAGMKFLIESFYRAITEDGPVPIPYREIIVTARIMDEVFRQLKERSQGARAKIPDALPG